MSISLKLGRLMFGFDVFGTGSGIQSMSSPISEARANLRLTESELDGYLKTAMFNCTKENRRDVSQT
eukprot:SAG11_NODE_519_length_8789_cov_17.198044_4_plen_67_part_00